MSCYLRHLKPMFEVLDLEYDKESRARVDAAIRHVLGFGADEPCPTVWAAVKAMDTDARGELTARVAVLLGVDELT